MYWIFARVTEENKIKSITGSENNNWTQERCNAKEESRLFYRESSLPPERNDILQKLLQPADWGVWNWHWQLFAMLKAACHLIVTGIWCTQVQYALGWSTVVFCECNVMQFFSVLFFVVRVVLKLDFRIVINETH